MDAFDFPRGEDDESRDASAKGGSRAAGGVDGAAAEAGDDGHGAHEGAHQVARPQREHLLTGVHALRRSCRVRKLELALRVTLT